MLWLIMAVVGGMLGPHVLKTGLGILGTGWKLRSDLDWVPYVVGAIFNVITLLAFAIMFLFKSQLRRFVIAYKNS